MIIDIHDVGHGACSVVTLPNQRRFMIDCGRSDTWSPSQFYAGQHIDGLIFQNLDKDHLEDLPNLHRSISVGRYFSNPTIDSFALGTMKKWDMAPGVASARDLLRNYGTANGSRIDMGPDCEELCMWHRYGTDFEETNNLSVAVFVRYGHFVMLYGGDMEEAGWRLMLQRPHFRNILPMVKVYVAAHHGRDNGCCEELFYYMQPSVVIISDYEHRFETQKTTAWYANRVLGIQDISGIQNALIPRPIRKVLTTRRDGHMKINARLDGGFHIQTQPSEPDYDLLAVINSLGA